MANRYESIGIKQTVRLEWLEKAAALVLAGVEPNAARAELHDFLGDRRGTGAKAERSAETRGSVVSILMKTWVTPDRQLLEFRNQGLSLLQSNTLKCLPVHWAMISAAYPFWFSVAIQTGRLLKLQNRTTLAQVTKRLQEHYGDRQTISRYARYVTSSFLAWQVITAPDAPGQYEKAGTARVSDLGIATFLLEGVLLTTPENQAVMGVLLSSPGLFPFDLPVVSGEMVARASSRLEVVRYGLDDELLKIKDQRILCKGPEEGQIKLGF